MCLVTRVVSHRHREHYHTGPPSRCFCEALHPKPAAVPCPKKKTQSLSDQESQDTVDWMKHQIYASGSTNEVPTGFQAMFGSCILRVFPSLRNRLDNLMVLTVNEYLLFLFFKWFSFLIQFFT